MFLIFVRVFSLKISPFFTFTATTTPEPPPPKTCPNLPMSFR